MTREERVDAAVRNYFAELATISKGPETARELMERAPNNEWLWPYDVSLIRDRFRRLT